MENSKEKNFFDKHEWKDVIEYRKIFLSRIKSLLLYFMEFLKDVTIVSIKYLN